MATHKTLTSAINTVAEKLDKIPNNIAEEVNRNAVPFTPVRTGRLVNSYEVKKSSGLGDDAIAHNDTPYAGYQEFGTIHISPRAMYRQSVQTISKKAKEYVD